MSKISKEFLAKALSEYQRYKGDKEALNQRVRENDYWYKARYGRIINPASNETEPVTAFIFSAIENKYADAIDNYPQPNILEREPSDVDLSKILSKIVPVQLDISDFKKAYKTNWRRKLKHGTGIYGVFYAKDDIVIKPLSILNVYCDMHLDSVQDSQFLFIVNAVDNDILKEEYPKHRDKFNGSTTIEAFDGTHEICDRTEIIDCYYKKGGAVHCMKLCRNEVIAATEDGDYPEGLYRHGLYPVVFDVLYPEEDCPFGFGIIDIAKNPQTYIDRLDGAIVKNSILSSKIRFMVKDNGSVNEDEVLNYENDVIHVAGSVDTDSVREFQTAGLPAYVMNHRTQKIDELKEVVGNRDFQQGGTSGGVTAASAISVLQEAGNKLSRSMIDDAYDSYKQVILMVVELMREFFTQERIYRITGDGGGLEYAKFSSDMMYTEKQRYSNMPEELQDILPDTWTAKEPIQFDVNIVPQKQNPFQREASNSTILQLWSAGFFNPQNIDLSVIALQQMSFDGRDKIIGQLKEYQEQFAAQQQAAQEEAVNQQRIAAGELVPIEQTIAEMDSGVADAGGGDELVPIEQTIQEMEG